MSDTKPAYRLTEWTPVPDQDAEICHLVDTDDVDNDAIIATFSNCETGARLAGAALALANCEVALTTALPVAVSKSA